jgi:hypothetical protein
MAKEPRVNNLPDWVAGGRALAMPQTLPPNSEEPKSYSSAASDGAFFLDEVMMFKSTILYSMGCAALLLSLVSGSPAFAQDAAKPASAKPSSQEAIEAALEIKSSCDFDDIPLSEVVAFFAQQKKSTSSSTSGR